MRVYNNARAYGGMKPAERYEWWEAQAEQNEAVATKASPEMTKVLRASATACREAADVERSLVAEEKVLRTE